MTEKHNFWRNGGQFHPHTVCRSMQLYCVTDLLCTISIFSTERSAFIDVTASIASVKACKHINHTIIIIFFYLKKSKLGSKDPKGYKIQNELKSKVWKG